MAILRHPPFFGRGVGLWEQYKQIMKIAYDGKRLFFNETGLGNYSRTLLRGLQQYFPENEYHLYTPEPKTKKQKKRMAEFQDLPLHMPQSKIGKRFPALWRSAFLAGELKRLKPEIYHGLSHELPWGIEKTGAKTVVTVHDLIFLHHPHLYKPWDAKIYQMKYLKSFQKADLLVAVSENTKNDLVRYMGISPEKVEVVYQSVHPRFEKQVEADFIQAVCREYGLPEKFLFYVGSLSERKNLLNLLDAFSRLRDKDFLLVVGGKGEEYRKKMEQRIGELNLNQRVIFLGHIPDEKLPALYRAASAFVYPSVYEGFGIPVIESLFCETPVVLSGDSCFRETAGPGGCYVDVANPAAIAEGIQKTLQDATLRRQLVREGREYVSRFEQQNCSSKMIDAYRRVLK